MNTSEKMRLGIIACDILEREIEFLTKDDPDFTYREYIEFALHENPPGDETRHYREGQRP